MTSETWIQVSNHCDYFVSSLGRVKSTKLYGDTRERILVPVKNKDGYLFVKCDNIRYSIHRLVALSYIPNPDNLEQINHKDLNKENNTVENLEWVSQQDNLYHAMDSRVHNWGRRAIKGTNIKTNEVIYFDSQAEAKRSGFNQPNINKCLKGERYQSKGYIWEYLNEE